MVTTTTTTKTTTIINGKPVTTTVVKVEQKQLPLSLQTPSATLLPKPSSTTTTTTTYYKSVASKPLSVEKPPSTDIPPHEFAEECMFRHNHYRALAGLPPLKWSDTLAAASQTWANHLASTNRFEHSHGKVGKYGENLYWTTNNKAICRDAMEAFYAEKKLYHGEPISNNNCHAIGHYTQLMWPTTTHVGCAIATDKSKQKHTIVFEYWPQGNILGQCAPHSF
ncbi:hypothetical protein O5D80_006791 [Batrachochytrium dendrobatidis]|nr:hypothetical protein O5D80_006791 [Batrachochytrium dendrobatidis]